MSSAAPQDIALGIRSQQLETLELPLIKARYPNQARDATLREEAGFFDLVADAQAILAARANLLGTEKQRFAVEVDSLIWFDPKLYGGVRLIDEEQAGDVLCLVSRWEVDCNREITRFELMG